MGVDVTKNPAYPDTLYVDNLAGPDTVNTLPETTITTFEDHGTVARTIDRDIDDASAVLAGLSRLGVDLTDLGHTLEDQGVAGFHDSFADVLETLTTKARHLTAR